MPSLPVKQNKNSFNINPKPLEKWILNFSGSALFHIKLEFASTILWMIVGIIACTLENYSNFLKKLLFNNGSILEINDYYNRSRRNVSFTELSEIINIKSRVYIYWTSAEVKKMRVN